MSARVAAGAAWMVGVHWGVRALGIISTIVLARLLLPEDFGLVALATAYIAIAEGLTEMPIGQALISFRDAGRSMYDTAWTLSAIRGVLIAAVMIASAGQMAAWMDDPRLEIIVYVLALKPLIEGLINSRFIDFQKELRFATPALLLLAIKVIQVIVTIVAVVILRNYWALVIGTLVSSVLHMAMTYVLMPNVPRLSLAEFRRLFAFSGWVSARNIVKSLNKQFEKFLIGALLNTSMVGIFHLAKELTVLPTRELVQPLTRALFPGLAVFGDEPEKLRANSVEATSIVAALAIPLGVGFALVAEEFVLLLLGEKWLDVVPLIQFITPLLALQQLTSLLNAIVMVKRKTHLLFLRQCFSLGIRIAFMTPFVYFFGFKGIIGGLALTAGVLFFYRLWEYSYVLKTPFFLPVISAWRSLASIAVMVPAVLGVASLLPTAVGTSWTVAFALLLKVLVGVVVYTSVHGALWQLAGRPRGLEARLLEMVSRRFPGRLIRT